MSKEKINLNISGMTCVNCSNGIENFLKRQDGVIDTKVSFASSEGEFTIDSKLYSKDKLVANIEKLGYKVEDDFEKLEQEQIKSFQKLKQLFITSMSLTIVIFALMFSNIFEDELNKKSYLYLLQLFSFIVVEDFIILHTKH